MYCPYRLAELCCDACCNTHCSRNRLAGTGLVQWAAGIHGRRRRKGLGSSEIRCQKQGYLFGRLLMYLIIFLDFFFNLWRCLGSLKKLPHLTEVAYLALLSKVDTLTLSPPADATFFSLAHLPHCPRARQ